MTGVGADDLDKLFFIGKSDSVTSNTIKDLKENRDTAYPLKLSQIDKAQKTDAALLRELRRDNCPYALNTFCGGGKELILLCKDERIVVPKNHCKVVPCQSHAPRCDTDTNVH